MRRPFILLAVVTLLGLVILSKAAVVSAKPVVEDGPTGGGGDAGQPVPVSAVGDGVRCWVEATGLTPEIAAKVAATLAPHALVTDIELRLPDRLARTTFRLPGGPRVPWATLSDGVVPLWRTSVLSDLLVSGQPLRVVTGSEACLPYPIQSISLTPMPLVRGRTAAMAIETEGLAFCRSTFLGKAEPCYRDGERLIVLIAVSAMAEPGVYPLEIELVVGDEPRAFALPLEVAAGHYGYQYIDPPPGLARLMDETLMASEAQYLAGWRVLRSADRHWDLPLALPLEQPVPVSAAFGDRRSYGGMVSGYHSGVDYRAWTGLPVISPADGIVVMAETLETRGNALLIDHGWGLVTGYWHLSRFDVQVGETVARGQKVAEVGNTGLSTGAHLHWEVWVNGVSVDGRQWLDADALPGVTLQPYQSSAETGVSMP